MTTADRIIIPLVDVAWLLFLLHGFKTCVAQGRPALALLYLAVFCFRITLHLTHPRALG